MGLHEFLGLDTNEWTGKPHRLISKKALCTFITVILLAFVMGVERVAFKAMIDELSSYSYFLCQFMSFIYIPPLFCLLGYYSTQEDFIEEDSSVEFPKRHFLVMGALDLAQAMMAYLTASRTSAAQTLFFMHAYVPLALGISTVIYKTQYSRLQSFGSLLILAGVITALLPSLADVFSNNFQSRQNGWHSILYLGATIPGTLSQLYKEHYIPEGPMDMLYLNAWITVYQFIGGLLIAPLVFNFESLHLHQHSNGLDCIVSGKTENVDDNCDTAWILVFIYVVANFLTTFISVKLVTRTSISSVQITALFGFVLAFVGLETYDFVLDVTLPTSFEDTVWKWLFTRQRFVQIVAFILLLVGKSMYQCDEDPGVEATTKSVEEREAASLLRNDSNETSIITSYS